MRPHFQYLSNKTPTISIIHANKITIKIFGINICMIVPKEKQVMAMPIIFIMSFRTPSPLLTDLYYATNKIFVKKYDPRINPLCNTLFFPKLR